MSGDELRELRAWRSRQALAVVVLALVLLPSAVALTVLAFVWPDVFFRSPAVIFLPLVLAWMWLLRKAPRRWWNAQRDRKSGEMVEWRGPVTLVARSGVGLIRVPRYDLVMDGERHPVSRFWAEQIVPGLEYTVHYAPHSRAVLSLRRREKGGQPVRTGERFALTRREKELLRYIAQGLTDKEIARVLNLSPATVRTYNSELYAKLGIERRTQAVPIAHELGLHTDI